LKKSIKINKNQHSLDFWRKKKQKKPIQSQSPQGLQRFRTKHKAPNGGCRSTPHWEPKKIKTLTLFLKKGSNPKKIQITPWALAVWQKFDQLKSRWSNFVLKYVAPISSRTTRKKEEYFFSAFLLDSIFAFKAPQFVLFPFFIAKRYKDTPKS